jgi:hypothetical protein
MFSATLIMTTSGSTRRRRATVSLSSPDARNKPAGQLNRAIETFQRVNRSLATTTINGEDLIALSGHLTQISRALLTLTDLLCTSAYHYDDRLPPRHAHTNTPLEQVPTVASLLQDCRDGYAAVYALAQALHAELKRRPQTRQ